MIIQHLNHWARINPDKTAVEADGVLISYLRFVRLIEATRRRIAKAQPRPGALAVILIHNLFDCWLASLACEALGLICISICDADAIEALELRSADLIIFNQPEAPRHDIARVVQFGLRPVLLPLTIYADDAVAFLDEITNSTPESGGYIFQSSGSTGTTKKILFLQNDEAELVRHSQAFQGLNSQSRLHVFNLALSGATAHRSARAAWSAGASVVIDQSDGNLDVSQFSANSVVRLTVELARALCAANSTSIAPAPGATTFVGGSALSFETVEKLQLLLGPDIVHVYGATEVAVPFITRIRTLEDLVWHRASGVIPFEVVDGRGHPAADGAEGCLRFPVSAWCVREYLDDPESSARAFRDCCFYPGDLAIRRSDGRVRILGRVSDVIIVNGHKWSLRTFEEQMCAYLHVFEACAFATQLPTSEDVLFVALRAPESPPASLLQQVQTFLPSFDDIRFVTFSSFPLTPTGKTDRMQLRTAFLKATPGKKM